MKLEQDHWALLGSQGPVPSMAELRGSLLGDSLWDSLLSNSLSCGDSGFWQGPSTLGSTHHPISWKDEASAPLGTYKHLDGDRDSTVQRRVASILGHDRQINQTIGYLFIIQGAAHTDH